ncbi:hypothetical protein [Aureimonas psammosilenae]|uniref:hypothetical protein n=1 Tax=Aureimonas psammosilenae TaxID=2495496 RepID=UPI001260BD9A|nr:hypothetical protein [Aureimonas psammosilenae]
MGMEVPTRSGLDADTEDHRDVQAAFLKLQIEPTLQPMRRTALDLIVGEPLKALRDQDIEAPSVMTGDCGKGFELTDDLLLRRAMPAGRFLEVLDPAIFHSCGSSESDRRLPGDRRRTGRAVLRCLAY